MQKIKRFVFTHFKWLFPLFLLLTIVSAMLVLKHNGCLKNEYSPHSVLSLQQSFDKKITDSIIRKWNKDSCNCPRVNAPQQLCADGAKCKKAIVYAAKSIRSDFLFIPCYIILLVLVLVRLNCRTPFTAFFDAAQDFAKQPPAFISQLTKLFIGFVIIAGIFDVAENIFMLRALNTMGTGLQYNPSSFATPSVVKMVLLGIVIIYFLVRASAWLTGFVLVTANLLWRLRIAVFSLLLLGLPIWLTDQGQDLLANVNNTHSGPIGLFITLSVLAVLNWHLPKLYSGTAAIAQPAPSVPNPQSGKFKIKQLITRNWDEAEVVQETKPNSDYEKKAGRMFGILTFLVPACAISSALDAFKADHLLSFISPVALLVVLMLFFYMVIRYNWLEKMNEYIRQNNHNRKGRLLRAALILFSILGLIKIILPAFGNSSAPDKMTTLQVNLIIMAVLFLLFTEYRNTKLLVNYFSGKKLNWLIWGGATFCILLFLLFNFKPLLLQRLNRAAGFRVEAIPLLISAIIFHTVFFSLLLLWGRRFKVDLISIFLVVGLVITISGSNNFHTVRRVKPENSMPAKDMAVFKDHLKQWLLYRKDEIERFDTSGGQRYPFFLVNSYGGGIRAAAWTSMLLSRLDQRLTATKRNPAFRDSLRRNFSHYTFAVSGISGGTVGLAVNTSYLYRQLAQNSSGQLLPPDSAKLFRFYQSDFLSPVTTLLLGRDILASVLRIENWDDRAAIMERVWEIQAKANRLGWLGVPFREIWNQSAPGVRYEIPLLFSNTYHAEAGVQGILAPVQLDSADFPSSTLLNNLDLVKERDLRLSTAAFISARFPYISPSARFNYEHHFIDGGAKEYSGCGTLFNLFQAIERIKKEDSLVGALMSKIQVYHFNIKNYLPREETKIVNNPFEITLPIKAVFQNGYGNTEEALLRMEQSVGRNNSFMIQPRIKYLNEEDCKKRYSPVLPLGWKISKDALMRMWKSVDFEERTPGSALQQLLKVFNE